MFSSATPAPQFSITAQATLVILISLKDKVTGAMDHLIYCPDGITFPLFLLTHLTVRVLVLFVLTLAAVIMMTSMITNMIISTTTNMIINMSTVNMIVNMSVNMTSNTVPLMLAMLDVVI